MDRTSGQLKGAGPATGGGTRKARLVRVWAGGYRRLTPPWAIKHFRAGRNPGRGSLTSVQDWPPVAVQPLAMVTIAMVVATAKS